MLQALTHKFRSGCMMLARRRGASVEFLGSAFLVHRRGYLLTAAHLVGDGDDLVVVPNEPDDDFLPMTSPTVAAMPVSVSARDTERDAALLYIDPDIDIGVPDDFLGAAATVRQGASVMSLGYAFGHHQVHSLMAFAAVVTAKIRSRNGTELILYGSAFHEGDRGGPLIHVGGSHIIGIISGRFEPAELRRDAPIDDRLRPAETNVSYAVAIEYGLALLSTATGTG
jgi:serine protease Do